MSERERERENYTSNYTGSLLTRATSNPQKITGYSLGNQQQITTHHNLKEVILTTQEHTHPLWLHIHSQNNPLTLQIHILQEFKLKKNQENMEQITSDYRKSQLLLIHSLTKAQPKAILLSWIQIFTKKSFMNLFFSNWNRKGNHNFIAHQTNRFN